MNLNSSVNEYMVMHSTRLRVSSWKFFMLLIPTSIFTYLTYDRSRYAYYSCLQYLCDREIRQYENKLLNYYKRNGLSISLQYVDTIQEDSFEKGLTRDKITELLGPNFLQEKYTSFYKYNEDHKSIVNQLRNKVNSLKKMEFVSIPYPPESYSDRRMNTEFENMDKKLTHIVVDLHSDKTIDNYKKYIDSEGEEIHKTLTSLYQNKMSLNWKKEVKHINDSVKMLNLHSKLSMRGEWLIIRRNQLQSEDSLLSSIKKYLCAFSLSCLLPLTRAVYGSLNKKKSKIYEFKKRSDELLRIYTFHSRVYFHDKKLSGKVDNL